MKPLALEHGWRYTAGAPAGVQRLGPSRTWQDEVLDLFREYEPRLQAHAYLAQGRTAEEVERFYVRLLAGTESSYPETFCCEIPDGLVVGDLGVVLTDRSEILVQSTAYGGANAAKLQTITGLAAGEPRAALRGTYVSMLGYGVESYAHWLVDLLPRLALVPEDERDFSVLVPAAPRPFQLRLLELLGVDRDRVVPVAGTAVRVERLLLCHPSPRTTRPVEQHLRRVRERLLAAAGAGGEPGALRLYVSRARATRSVVNEDELTGVLAAHGFETVFPEQLDPAEQIQLFARADAIAGPHGAGMLNCVVAPRGAKVFELFAPGWFFPPTLGAASLLGLEHWYLFGQPAGEAHEIHVDPARLDRLLSLGLS